MIILLRKETKDYKFPSSVYLITVFKKLGKIASYTSAFNVFCSCFWCSASWLFSRTLRFQRFSGHKINVCSFFFGWQGPGLDLGLCQELWLCLSPLSWLVVSWPKMSRDHQSGSESEVDTINLLAPIIQILAIYQSCVNGLYAHSAFVSNSFLLKKSTWKKIIFSSVLQVRFAPKGWTWPVSWFQTKWGW